MVVVSELEDGALMRKVEILWMRKEERREVGSMFRREEVIELQLPQIYVLRSSFNPVVQKRLGSRGTRKRGAVRGLYKHLKREAGLNDRPTSAANACVNLISPCL